jgi:hypothetical protein
MIVEEFDAWLNGVPAVDIGRPEFDAWLDGAPVLDNGGEETIAGDIRRRAFIF